MWAHREKYTKTKAWCESSERYTWKKHYKIAYGLGNKTKTQKRKGKIPSLLLLKHIIGSKSFDEILNI